MGTLPTCKGSEPRASGSYMLNFPPPNRSMKYPYLGPCGMSGNHSHAYLSATVQKTHTQRIPPQMPFLLLTQVGKIDILIDHVLSAKGFFFFIYII